MFYIDNRVSLKLKYVNVLINNTNNKSYVIQLPILTLNHIGWACHIRPNFYY